MQNGDARANGNGLSNANFGPKYEQHISEMQAQLDEANKKCETPSICTNQEGRRSLASTEEQEIERCPHCFRLCSFEDLSAFRKIDSPS